MKFSFKAVATSQDSTGLRFPVSSVIQVLFCPQADVELPIPRYFLSENAKVLKEREKLLGSILAQMEAQDDTKVSVCV